MDRRETFILTLFCDPRRSAGLRGRLRHVTSSREATFKDLQDLTLLLREFFGSNEEQKTDGIADQESI